MQGENLSSVARLTNEHSTFSRVRQVRYVCNTAILPSSKPLTADRQPNSHPRRNRFPVCRRNGLSVRSIFLPTSNSLLHHLLISQLTAVPPWSSLVHRPRCLEEHAQITCESPLPSLDPATLLGRSKRPAIMTASLPVVSLLQQKDPADPTTQRPGPPGRSSSGIPSAEAQIDQGTLALRDASSCPRP